MSDDPSSKDLLLEGRSAEHLPYGVDTIVLRIEWPAAPASRGYNRCIGSGIWHKPNSRPGLESVRPTPAGHDQRAPVRLKPNLGRSPRA